MSKVRIKSAEIPAQLIDLKPGTNRFGRESSNDFQISHPSISASHCEIILEKDSIRIRDLGSTNGTFIEGARINEAILKPGQNFYLGSVELAIESGSIGNAAMNSPANLVRCVQHQRIFATAQCPKCQSFFCDYCIMTRSIEGEMKKFCRRCKSECALVNLDSFGAETDDRRAFALFTNAVRYPVQRHGWVLLLGGSLLLFFIDMVMAGLSLGTPSMAAFALVFGVLGCGYLFAFMQRIISSTALGEEKMPGWPDFTEVWQDMFQPFRLLWGLFAACFGPALVCWYFAYNGSDFAEKAQVPLIVAGFLYLPMALLAVAMSDSLSSLNPLLVLGSICKVPLQYLIACLLLAFIIGLKWAVEVAMEKVVPIFAIRYLISAVLFLYFLIVEMRLLGLMYFWNRRKLAWI
ncbi:MAG: FHA domain-containing protein [Verrucomicrobiota bacterium]